LTTLSEYVEYVPSSVSGRGGGGASRRDDERDLNADEPYLG